jgi:hypothetical protein
VSNRRYAVEVELSREFHALLRELELLGFTAAQGEGGCFISRAQVQTGYGPLAVEMRGRAAGDRLELAVDLRDPPNAHVPEPVCDTVALKLAGVVARALGADAKVRCLGWLPGARPLKPLSRGEVRVHRVPCG